ncbi:hypothetical protein ACJD0Z_06285 [Flavobacteriaceae bacterium M23B6Z8]
MIKKAIFLFIILLSASCDKISDDELKQHLPGYWEITKVVTAEGDAKEYKVSTTIDLIKLTDHRKGFRKKVQPNLNGTFFGSDDLEEFSIIEKDDHYWMAYTTDLMKWKEKIKSISKDEFIVENENGLTYYYKRYTPLKIDE